MSLDRAKLLAEIEDLIQVDADAKAKAEALATAQSAQATTREEGDVKLMELQTTVDADNAAAAAAVVTAEVASKVATELRSAQIEFIKGLLDEAAGEDPTPTPFIPTP